MECGQTSVNCLLRRNVEFEGKALDLVVFYANIRKRLPLSCYDNRCERRSVTRKCDTTRIAFAVLCWNMRIACSVVTSEYSNDVTLSVLLLFEERFRGWFI
jgi:hypothetical protein